MGWRQAALGMTWHSQAVGSSVVWLSKGWVRLLCVRLRVCWHIKLRSSACCLLTLSSQVPQRNSLLCWTLLKALLTADNKPL